MLTLHNTLLDFSLLRQQLVVGGAAVGAVGGYAAVWHVQILVLLLGKCQRGEECMVG